MFKLYLIAEKKLHLKLNMALKSSNKYYTIMKKLKYVSK